MNLNMHEIAKQLVLSSKTNDRKTTAQILNLNQQSDIYKSLTPQERIAVDASLLEMFDQTGCIMEVLTQEQTIEAIKRWEM